jgi:hypothetical protein
MKTRILLTGVIIALTAFFAVTAQSNDPAVKILPAAEQGTLKLVYAYDSGNPVVVKFIDENGLLKTDRISEGSFNNGFLKKYDVSRIKARGFWVEVSSGDLTVRYKMVNDQKGRLVPYLEQTTYNHPMVATIN